MSDIRAAPADWKEQLQQHEHVEQQLVAVTQQLVAATREVTNLKRTLKTMPPSPSKGTQ